MSDDEDRKPSLDEMTESELLDELQRRGWRLCGELRSTTYGKTRSFCNDMWNRGHASVTRSATGSTYSDAIRVFLKQLDAEGNGA